LLSVNLQINTSNLLARQSLSLCHSTKITDGLIQPVRESVVHPLLPNGVTRITTAHQ
jgi:hypothetical protein